jgi:hypothetical protein
MTTMKKTIALFGLAMAACTNGQGSVDITTSNQAVFPIPVALPATLGQVSLTTETDVNLDVHDELASMAKVGTLSVVLSQDSVSGAGLAQVDQVTATIATADGMMPAQPLAQAVAIPGSAEVDLPSLLSDAQVLGYLQEGPVVVHLTLTGALPAQAITLNYSLVAHVAIGVAVSVQNL